MSPEGDAAQHHITNTKEKKSDEKDVSLYFGALHDLFPCSLDTCSAQYTPVTVGISRLIDNQTPWEMVMTGTIISIIPAVIIYLMVQKP